jgi:hypothetical protein
MEPDIFDKHILDWCNQNNWERPQKENGTWYAIAPNTCTPQPVPASEEFKQLMDEATDLYNSSIFTVAVSFRQVADARNNQNSG